MLLIIDCIDYKWSILPLSVLCSDYKASFLPRNVLCIVCKAIFLPRNMLCIDYKAIFLPRNVLCIVCKATFLPRNVLCIVCKAHHRLHPFPYTLYIIRARGGYCLFTRVQPVGMPLLPSGQVAEVAAVKVPVALTPLSQLLVLLLSLMPLVARQVTLLRLEQPENIW